jgi:hypothetical protein
MTLINATLPRRTLLLAYLLFAVSLALPTISVDLGENGGPVQTGYRVFIGGPVAAAGIILEPGGEQRNRYMGIHYLMTWLANLALLLPFVRVLSTVLRRALTLIFTLLAWSVLASYLMIPDNLVREIGVGYYFWAAAITLIMLFFRVSAGASERVELSPGPR